MTSFAPTVVAAARAARYFSRFSLPPPAWLRGFGLPVLLFFARPELDEG